MAKTKVIAVDGKEQLTWKTSSLSLLWLSSSVWLPVTSIKRRSGASSASAVPAAAPAMATAAEIAAVAELPKQSNLRHNFPSVFLSLQQKRFSVWGTAFVLIILIWFSAEFLS